MNALPAPLPNHDPVMLKALGQELAELGRMGTKLQELLAGEVRQGRLSQAAMMDAQVADLLTQYLNEIAKFLEAYTSAIEQEAPDPLGSAVNALMLGELAKRMRNLGKPMEAEPRPDDNVEMF